jgi:hypothetical protein
MQRSFLFLVPALLAACATQDPGMGQAPAEQPSLPRAAADNAALPSAPASRPAAPSAGHFASLRDWVSRKDSLYMVAAPLLINNTLLCKRHTRTLAGFTAKTKYSYSAEYAGAAQEAFNLDERLRVMNVMPGSGADRSGLMFGDVLLSLQGKAIPAGKDAEREAALMVGAAMEGRNSINLTVLRDGRQVALDIPLTRACAIGIELGDADVVNSYADSERVMITRGMLDYVKSDEELAYALAKELAHAALNQGPRPAMAATITSLLRFAPAPASTPGMALAAGAASRPAAGTVKPYSPVLDSTADKLSLYMLVRAGYSIDNTLGFWKQLASRYPSTVPNSHTALHPASAYRFSVINAVVPAIKAKQKNRMPLVP